MKESKTVMLLHPGSSIPASHAARSLLKYAKEMPVPSDDHCPVHARTTKDPQPPVMPTGKPGPANLKCVKAEIQPIAPPTKKSRGGKLVTNKPKATVSKKKTATEPMPSHGTRSQAKCLPSPAHKLVDNPPGDDKDNQVNDKENLKKLNTVTSGPGISRIPIINCHNHKSYLPLSMIPREGMYLFPTVEPKPIKKDEVHELIKDEAIIMPAMSPASSVGGETIVMLAIMVASLSIPSRLIRTPVVAYVEAMLTNVHKHL
ncbi:hypothetical protein IW262DRAFT_1297796 [Armillaria fumosa]|nr:hypothetical protein IW262DRAFT_1297796 [Armillaria fumosa]